MLKCGRRGGLMVSGLYSGASDPGSTLTRDIMCCVLGQDTLLPQVAPLDLGV